MPVGLSVTVQKKSWPLRQVFRISRGAKTTAEVIEVTLSDGTYQGRGECVPYGRYGETLDTVAGAIQSVIPDIELGADRQALQLLLPAGAARNALDCAFWDLEAKRAGVRLWDMLGTPAPAGCVTAFTISYDSTHGMAAAAKKVAGRPVLKMKVGSLGDVDKVRAVHQAAPQAQLILDANEGWDCLGFQGVMDGLKKLDHAVDCITAIEQPLPVGDDHILRAGHHEFNLVADESCHTRDSLQALVGRYDGVNIKLDKTGGLTEALLLKKQAEDMGFKIMIGCMVGSSLAMAPAMMLCREAEWVDLDGPLWLGQDQDPPLHIDSKSLMALPDTILWG